jgi:hypothetical protein
MGVDIRLPIGGLFAILGAMLLGYGLITHGNEMYVQKSLGYNINLWWGLVMLAFGLIMLWFSRRGTASAKTEEEMEAEQAAKGERVAPRH